MTNGYNAIFSGQPVTLEDLLNFFDKSNKKLFDKIISGFVVYSNNVYDLDESGGEEVYSFLSNFFEKKPNESAQSFFGVDLLILCFRPKTDNLESLNLVREALTYFDYESSKVYVGYTTIDENNKISYHNFP